MLLGACSPIVHTNTPENADENRDFRKTVSKVETFENASFLVWTGETETFENDDVKSVACHRFQTKSEDLSKMVL